MKFNRGISLIVFFFVVVILMAIVFGFTYFSGRDGLKIIVNNLSYFTPFKIALKMDPKINDFYVKGEYFIVKGKYLNKVEVWYVFNSFGPEETSKQIVLESSKYREFFLNQKFKLRIGCGPFSPVRVFARGYNEVDGSSVGDLDLSLSTAGEFYNATCPKDKNIDTRDGFFFLDSITGINVPNVIITIDDNGFKDPRSFVDYVSTLPKGDYKISLSSPGYKEMKDFVFNVPVNLNNMFLNLTPLAHQDDSPKQAKDKLRIYGYVSDEIHNPVRDVSVLLSNYNISTVTDNNGFFYIDISPQTADLCTSNTLIFSKDGYEKNIINNFGSGYIKTGFEGTSVKTQIVLKKGNGDFISDQKYHMCP